MIKHTSPRKPPNARSARNVEIRTSNLTLTRRALTALVRFEVSLAVMLQVCAWDLHYWQGWLFLALFGVCNLGITLYFLKHDPALIRRRLAVGAQAELRPRQRQLQGLAGLLVVVLVLLSGFDHRFGWSKVPWTLVLTGEAMLVSAMIWVFVVFQFNSYTAATVTVEPGQTVAAGGPYALVRHPMYLGATLGFLATAISLGSWYALIVAVPLTVLMCLRLLDEERYLAESLPGYREYQAKVPDRLIPGVW